MISFGAVDHRGRRLSEPQICNGQDKWTRTVTVIIWEQQVNVKRIVTADVSR